MYPVGDPRRALQTEGLPSSSSRPPQFFELSTVTPTEATPGGSRTWLLRTENLLLAYTEGNEGDEFDCSSTMDEVLVFAPDGSTIAALSGEIELSGCSLAVLPAGTAWVRLMSSGRLVRVFAARSTDLTSAAINRSDYAGADSRIPAFVPWERVSSDGPQVFSYENLDRSAGRFGRIFRSDAAMVNIFYPEDGPRDPTALSPHWHADFDQLTLQLEGDYTHHIRAEWGPDSTAWRPDIHRTCSSPAIAIIPPPLIHTSQAIGTGVHELVDVFGPPRADFAAQPGWLLNG